MQIIAGAVVFAVGVFFGMCAILAGQESAKNKTAKRFQDALLKSMENNGAKGN